MFRRLLALILPRRERERVLADLEEEFLAELLPRAGRRAARRWYRHEALSLAGSYLWHTVLLGRPREISIVLAARRFRRRMDGYSSYRERTWLSGSAPTSPSSPCCTPFF